jgi:CcmD family protein
MKQLQHIALTLLAFCLSIPVLAQMREQPEMADLMRSNGKIYVVVVVAALVFIGITIYLINLDRRIKKLEKDNK